MEKEYFLGLDIGTNSIGYAVTAPDYSLCKFRGEPMWGVHLFEEAHTAQERRTFRTARRRLDRRRQRVRLLEELFAKEITAIDANFFLRRRESALWTKEDTAHDVRLFDGGGLTDAEYHTDYPTIHHLICDLMTATTPRDIRLVYIACAWLVANRGHFLLDIPNENIRDILNFDRLYRDFCDYVNAQGYSLPWTSQVPADSLSEILNRNVGVRKKEEELRQNLYGGKKVDKDVSDEFPFNQAALLTLLAGGTVKPADLFGNKAYAELGSIKLGMDEEEFAHALSELPEDTELLCKLRAMHDGAQLLCAMNGCSCLSAGKVATYETHKADLRFLKDFIKKYCRHEYDNIFRRYVKNNYVCYSGYEKSLTDNEKQTVEHTDKEAFSDFLLKKVRNVPVDETDEGKYQDMLSRLATRTFLPKQKDSDNRVIPQQLYRYELKEILDHAQSYLPLLSEQDAQGLTVKEKILSIFDFRIPYYVGPLKKTDNQSNHAWICRKSEEKITPWNFAQQVDLDKSEAAFIRRMTNRCTYLPAEDVLPVNSLLYERFMVLNEINPLKVNGHPIDVAVKQELYTQVFAQKPRVTFKAIREFLLCRGYMQDTDVLSGLDTTVKSNLKSFHIFKRMLESGKLTEDDVENIIGHAAFSEDKARMRRWLETTFSQLDADDISYILRQKLKEFGRLSEQFLRGLYGGRKDTDTGEALTIIDTLWETNDNLNQILSDNYTFNDQIAAIRQDYYANHSLSLNDRLDDMYVSNAVKRPIIRALDIVRDVTKATGGEPTKIFIEMARGGTPAQKGVRTKSRKEQILELYKTAKEDTHALQIELEKMGALADNRLQSDRVFLYFLQCGKCAYTGEPINLERIADGSYNLEHIYPQCYVKDDSVLNNLVLVKSEVNGLKSNTYPVPAAIRQAMTGFWLSLKKQGLMTEEKHRRLTRSDPFKPDEQMGFINRQMVETRQSTKVIKDLLQEQFPHTEIVCVKAGLVSEFRQEFRMLKCRSVNDLHHAKDAYLNIVVGNVYHERFTKRWFSLDQDYNVQVGKIFKKEQAHGDVCYWRGENGLADVRRVMGKNAVHITRYAFCRKGELFDQQPKKHAKNLIPLKKGLDPQRYGGYQKPTATFFVLARFKRGKNAEIKLVPIPLLYADRFLQSEQAAQEITAQEIGNIVTKPVCAVELLLQGRPLKVNTAFSLDGTRVTITGKSGGGKDVLISSLEPLVLGEAWETYVKAMERFLEKQKVNPHIVLDEAHDHLSRGKNIDLYALLTAKMKARPFVHLPNNQAAALEQGTARFAGLDEAEQMKTLMNILQWFGAGAGSVNLESIGASKNAGAKSLNSNLSNWKKKYTDVRIIDQTASGLFACRSENLMEWL